jgi:hypothetical protein
LTGERVIADVHVFDVSHAAEHTLGRLGQSNK